jgi:hypothetical protein
MSRAEDHIRSMVDQTLEPVWSYERCRALWRWRCETAGRVGAGLVALLILGIGVHLLVGVTVPWTFFGFTGFLMTVLAFSQTEGREHLRQD